MENNCMHTRLKGTVDNPNLPSFIYQVFDSSTVRRGYGVFVNGALSTYNVDANQTMVVSAQIPIPEGAKKVVYKNLQFSNVARYGIWRTIDDTANTEFGGILDSSGTGEITLTSEMIANGKYITITVYRGENAASVDLSSVFIGFKFV